MTPENIRTLVGMGFNDNVDMRIALRLSNGNIQHAVSVVISRMVLADKINLIFRLKLRFYLLIIRRPKIK